MKSLEPTDKRKTCVDILQGVQMNVRNYLEKPLKPEVVLHEVLAWYKITEQQLFQFRHIKEKRLFMFLLHEACNLHYEKIAETAKCKSELQVIHEIEKIKEAMKKDRIMLANMGGIVERAKALTEMYSKESNPQKK